VTARQGAEPLRCVHCQELIGIYEPMVVVADGVPVRTSGAALSGDELLAGEHFHSDCFADRGPDQPPA